MAPRPSKVGHRAFVAALLTSAIAGLSPAHATDYVFSTYMEPQHTFTEFGVAPFAAAVEERSGGEVTFEVFTGGAILPASSSLQGLADGVAQGAYVTAGYMPAQMPLWNTIGDLGWLVPDDLAITLAATEFGLLDEDGRREWLDNGGIFMGSASTPVYNFICRRPQQSLADFRGLRIRAPGNAWSRFIEEIGAVPTNIPYTEMYTALERGALDCTTADITHLATGATIGGVVDAVIDLDMGPYFTQSLLTFNKDFWAEISVENRQIIVEEAAHAILGVSLAQAEAIDKSLAYAEANEIQIVTPDDDLSAAYTAFVEGGLGGLNEIAARNNVPNYERALASFTDLLTKWEGLLEGVDRTDAEALHALAMSEIYSKLDLETYGLD